MAAHLVRGEVGHADCRDDPAPPTTKNVRELPRYTTISWLEMHPKTAVLEVNEVVFTVLTANLY